MAQPANHTRVLPQTDAPVPWHHHLLRAVEGGAWVASVAATVVAGCFYANLMLHLRWEDVLDRGASALLEVAALTGIVGIVIGALAGLTPPAFERTRNWLLLMAGGIALALATFPLHVLALRVAPELQEGMGMPYGAAMLGAPPVIGFAAFGLLRPALDRLTGPALPLRLALLLIPAALLTTLVRVILLWSASHAHV